MPNTTAESRARFPQQRTHKKSNTKKKWKKMKMTMRMNNHSRRTPILMVSLNLRWWREKQRKNWKNWKTVKTLTSIHREQRNDNEHENEKQIERENPKAKNENSVEILKTTKQEEEEETMAMNLREEMTNWSWDKKFVAVFVKGPTQQSAHD